MDKLRKLYTRKPTLRQVLAYKFITQGMSRRQAMIKAGYSINTSSNPQKNLMSKDGTKLIMDNLKKNFLDMGMTSQFMAEKFWEWLNAKKIHTSQTEPDRQVPDYDTQIKAYDRWEKVVTGDQKVNQIKRQLTVTEFVMGKEKG